MAVSTPPWRARDTACANTPPACPPPVNLLWTNGSELPLSFFEVGNCVCFDMMEKDEPVSDGPVAGHEGVLGGDSEAARVKGSGGEYDLTQSHDQLSRGLKSRHIQFLALGEYLAPGIC